MHEPLILAIETSCDDTAASVLRGLDVLSNVISSQDIHDHYGGIVPELASREHVKGIAPIVLAALQEAGCTTSDLDAIAVTYGPGLPGSLIVGSHFAKGLAMRLGIPIFPVHHIEAHLYSGHLEDPTLEFPALCLVVSGGHTSIVLLRSLHSFEVLGSTRDDAAGEAFDKVAKLVGLGYPGGPHVDRLAKDGNPRAIEFPRGLMHDGTFNFSFSGLKTSVRYYLRDHPDAPIHDVCASVQRAIVDVLVSKTLKAALEHDVRAIVVAGGVSANSELRARFAEECTKRHMRFVAPRSAYCVDNAAMIGFVAAHRYREGHRPMDYSFTIASHALRASD